MRRNDEKKNEGNAEIKNKQIAEWKKKIIRK